MNHMQGWTFMQDNAPAHNAKLTIEDFNERGIYPVTWPPFSPDLNPIEHVWKWMKDWIERERPHNITGDTLRTSINEAWAALPEEILLRLMASMPRRMRDVIRTEGGHTRY